MNETELDSTWCHTSSNLEDERKVDKDSEAKILQDLTRVLCRSDPETHGPTLLVIAGIHGNEPAGVLAVRRVCLELQRLQISLKGRFVALAGNLVALASGIRFLEKDLNRLWEDERLPELHGATATETASAEVHEQLGLLAAIDEVLESATGEVYFLDLHTTSADSAPFVIIGDTLRNRAFAEHFPVPRILGLEEAVDGALLEFMNGRGAVTLGFEAGQHESPASVERHEAALWIALHASGLLLSKSSELQQFHRLLEQSAIGVPRILEVRYRHGIVADDDFKMNSGFFNLAKVADGEGLARDRHGEIRAKESGYILLPLYQGKGNDGFFMAREVKPFWLHISALLRHLRLDKIVHLLPGVRRHPQREGALLVDPSVARWYVYEFFHLLGFRKRRSEGRLLVVSKRKFDLRSPRRQNIHDNTDI